MTNNDTLNGADKLDFRRQNNQASETSNKNNNLSCLQLDYENTSVNGQRKERRLTNRTVSTIGSYTTDRKIDESVAILNSLDLKTDKLEVCHYRKQIKELYKNIDRMKVFVKRFRKENKERNWVDIRPNRCPVQPYCAACW